MIIIEGPNACGKSTLAEFLSQRLDWPIYKFPTPKDSKDAVRNFDATITIPDHTILDRHPMISDQIYAPIMFPETNPIPWQYEVIKDHILIYCVVPIGTAIHRHEYKKDDPFYRNELRIFTDYESLFSSLTHICFNWTQNSRMDLLKEIEAKI